MSLDTSPDAVPDNDPLPQDWNFTTTEQVGLSGRVIPYTRGHVLGGSTSVSEFAAQ